MVRRVTWDRLEKKRNNAARTSSSLPALVSRNSSSRVPLPTWLSSDISRPNRIRIFTGLTLKVAGVGDHRSEFLQLAQRTHDLRFLRLRLAHGRRRYLCVRVRRWKISVSHSRERSVSAGNTDISLYRTMVPLDAAIGCSIENFRAAWKTRNYRRSISTFEKKAGLSNEISTEPRR